MIELRHVTFFYKGNLPEQEDVSGAAKGNTGGLKDVSLTVQDGECILLCGRSGCGKTTITRLLNGLIPGFYAGTLRGEIRINGKNPADLPMYEIAETVGSVFQNPRTQFFNVDSDSEIAFGLENRACPPEELRKRVEETAKALGIEKLRGRPLCELSGGEKQKIAFASVYAMNPDIYLLDEPSSNLDAESIRDLKKHLELIKRQGKTILIAEHRLYYLMELADRIVYLERGEISRVYTPEQLKTLSDEQRMQMGLRAVDLHTVLPGVKQAVRPVPLLELKNVSAGFRKHPVLKHISLEAGAGEIIGIVGKNGAGKTTLSRTLCGLHKHSGGEILWEGEPQKARDRLMRSYMVMQDVNYELFAESVRAECSFGIRNPDTALVDSTLQKLSLLPYQNQHPNTLSGGQKQRVAVAVSMICRKKLYIFDEPTSGLDFDSMEQVAGLIKELAAAGNLIFIVTHDYEFICRTCSRLLYLAKGELNEEISVSIDSMEIIKALCT